MSVDEVLASSLWLWPDPLLKRDRAGHVLFVNAAFLHLYGGQAQDWYAKPLVGWPAPVMSGAQRFETRIGEGATQNIYDWVESAMADGNALAIARNVTVFMTPQMQQAPQVIEPAPPITPPQVAPQAAPQAHIPPTPQQTAPSLATAIEDTRSMRADQFAHEDNYDTNQPVQHTSGEQTPGPNIAHPPHQVPQQNLEAGALPVPPTPVPLTQVPPTNLEAETNPAEPEAPAPQEERRMIERRALPIKDSTVMLGSNWRDEVIAKAVGAVTSEDVETPTTVKTASETEEAGEDVPTKAAEGLRILLAEDNAINALLTRTLLEADGAEVDTVEDGALAVQAVGQKTYDLIFMDMRMPNMDGLESTRKIRAFGAKMPIIALTANAFDDDRNACFDSGMNDFMTKPVSAEELSEMVETWTKKDEGEDRLAS